eukprot:gene3866-4828_t
MPERSGTQPGTGPNALDKLSQEIKSATVAFGELVDNVADEARLERKEVPDKCYQIDIDFIDRGFEPSKPQINISVQDNGPGPRCERGGLKDKVIGKMLGFGLSDKNGISSIGLHGMGIKHCAMRLAHHLLAFCKTEHEAIVTLMSPSWMRNTGYGEQVTYPYVLYEIIRTRNPDDSEDEEFILMDRFEAQSMNEFCSRYVPQMRPSTIVKKLGDMDRTGVRYELFEMRNPKEFDLNMERERKDVVALKNDNSGEVWSPTVQRAGHPQKIKVPEDWSLRKLLEVVLLTEDSSPLVKIKLQKEDVIPRNILSNTPVLMDGTVGGFLHQDRYVFELIIPYVDPAIDRTVRFKKAVLLLGFADEETCRKLKTVPGGKITGVAGKSKQSATKTVKVESKQSATKTVKVGGIFWYTNGRLVTMYKCSDFQLYREGNVGGALLGVYLDRPFNLQELEEMKLAEQRCFLRLDRGKTGYDETDGLLVPTMNIVSATAQKYFYDYQLQDRAGKACEPERQKRLASPPKSDINIKEKDLTPEDRSNLPDWIREDDRVFENHRLKDENLQRIVVMLLVASHSLGASEQHFVHDRFWEIDMQGTKELTSIKELFLELAEKFTE